jgi:hypothetical protein
MPLLITKIIKKNESRKNKKVASACWSPSATLHGKHIEIFLPAAHGRE